MIPILPQASTLTSHVPLTPGFTSPSVICSIVGNLVMSQACQTKDRLFEPQSGHFLFLFIVSIVCPNLKVKHSSQSLI